MKKFLALLASILALVASEEYNSESRNFNITAEPEPEEIYLPAKTYIRGGRVVNGQSADDFQFPWAVELSINGGIICTGSIISSTFVLSARHCIAGGITTSVAIYYGSADKQSSLRQKAYVNKVWYLTVADADHPDIAIFRLDKAISFNDRVKPIRLPKRSQEGDTFDGREAVYSGWGGAYDGFPRFLQYGSFILRSDCGFRDFQLCSRGVGTTATRGGDSGGPLVIYEDQPTLIGIHVFRVGENTSGSTRVAKFLQFINDITGIPIRN